MTEIAKSGKKSRKQEILQLTLPVRVMPLALRVRPDGSPINTRIARIRYAYWLACYAYGQPATRMTRGKILHKIPQNHPLRVRRSVTRIAPSLVRVCYAYGQRAVLERSLPCLLRVIPMLLRVTPAAMTEKPDFSFCNSCCKFSKSLGNPTDSNIFFETNTYAYSPNT